ncbi:hypothetical protein [Dyadobacter sp. CY326]|uniref:hypothetical protein n=1 Tax=Dyadobacter sp. CY326 TaxID=2907300 RepID=UPI001F26F0B9|nr:hypothetical protein [Dyadobacter sp. CY326]MCE7067988.1 hypothetical protein [Dyadobacter sp. CY326]
MKVHPLLFGLALFVVCSCSKKDSVDDIGTIADLSMNYHHTYQSVVEDTSQHEQITWKIKRIDVNKIEIEELIKDITTNKVIRKSIYNNVVSVSDQDGHNFLDFKKATTNFPYESVFEGSAALYATALRTDVIIWTKEKTLRKNDWTLVAVEEM